MSTNIPRGTAMTEVSFVPIAVGALRAGLVDVNSGEWFRAEVADGDSYTSSSCSCRHGDVGCWMLDVVQKLQKEKLFF